MNKKKIKKDTIGKDGPPLNKQKQGKAAKQNKQNTQNRVEVVVPLGKALVSKPSCPNSTSEIS